MAFIDVKDKLGRMVGRVYYDDLAAVIEEEPNREWDVVARRCVRCGMDEVEYWADPHACIPVRGEIHDDVGYDS